MHHGPVEHSALIYMKMADTMASSRLKPLRLVPLKPEPSVERVSARQVENSNLAGAGGELGSDAAASERIFYVSG